MSAIRPAGRTKAVVSAAIIALALSALIVLQGCQSAPPPPKGKPGAKHSAAGKTVSNPKEEASPASDESTKKEVWRYVALNDLGDKRRDPFEAYREPEPTGPVMLGPTRPLEELEHYDLDQIKIVGIISGIPNPKAKVQDPTGKIHTVKMNSRMGKHNGRVIAILEKKIVVREKYIDVATGDVKVVNTDLEMPR